MERDPCPTLHFGSAILLLSMAIVFVSAGCGAAGPMNAGGLESKATSPMSESAMVPPPPPARLDSIPDGEALLANGEYELRLALGPDKREYQGQFAQPPAAQTEEARSSRTDGGDAKPKDGEAKAAGGMATGSPAPVPQQASADSASGTAANPCVTACKALASMDRAASHICSLAGDDDSRCTNARERVRWASERVRQSCPDCGS